MRVPLILALLLAFVGVTAQTAGDILSQVSTSAGIAFPTLNSLAQDPYVTLTKNMATSRVALSANKDSNHFFLSAGLQYGAIKNETNWTSDILNGTSITALPGFAHVTQTSTPTELVFTMIDPLSGLPSVNPLTGGPITIETVQNTGVNLPAIPFGTMGIGYKRGPFYIEGAYLPLSALSSSLSLPFDVSLTNSHMGRISLGGVIPVTKKISTNINGGINLVNINVKFQQDTLATIDQEGQVFTIANDMESMKVSNMLYNLNAGLAYNLSKKIRVELGVLSYASQLDLDQTGPITLYLQTNNPVDGSTVTASEELIDIMDGRISSGLIVSPYLHLSLSTKRNSVSFVMTSSNISMNIIL